MLRNPVKRKQSIHGEPSFAASFGNFAVHSYSSSAALVFPRSKSKDRGKVHQITDFFRGPSLQLTGLPNQPEGSERSKLEHGCRGSCGDLSACRLGQGGARSTSHRENYMKIADKKNNNYTDDIYSTQTRCHGPISAWLRGAGSWKPVKGLLLPSSSQKLYTASVSGLGTWILV